MTKIALVTGNNGGVKKKLGLGKLLKTLRRDLRLSSETSRTKTSVTHTLQSTSRVSNAFIRKNVSIRVK